MPSGHLAENMEGVVDMHDRQLIPPCGADGDMFEDRKVVPCVGDQYQAEIPPLEDDKDRLQPNHQNSDCAGSPGVQESFLSPIPIMWLRYSVEDTNGAVQFENYKDQVAREYSIPESSDESWSNIERDGFLLGLHIFGKNLALVGRFVESKTMCSIQAFYYGKFYRSAEYRRWSEAWKLRSKRCVIGQKIFSGWRQQELFSRLCSRVSEACKNKLQEVSRAFEDGKISFEKYVFGLRDEIGIGLFLEAVGIGKGKQDLTGVALERIKTNNAFSAHPQIPVGQACSNLSSAEIKKFLTGGFRLSKSRSSDLFWEAVWPRLLAKGWNSEQPKDYASRGQNQSLVFLLPGVKKFSKKLIRGNHFFDSVSDVLNKVASEPGLLELESGDNNGNANSELLKQEVDGLSDEQRSKYLHPHRPDCSRELVRFTIVDTSCIDEEGKLVRELTYRRNEMFKFTCSPVSRKTATSSGESKVEVEEIKIYHPAQVVAGIVEHSDSQNCITGILSNGLPKASDPAESGEEDHQTHDNSVFSGKQPTENMNSQSRQQAKSDHSHHLAPGNSASEVLCVEQPKPFELNSHMSQEHATDESSTANMMQEDDNLNTSEQQPTVRNCRQSTRNRLLTVRAWEALEHGFLDAKGKRKSEGAPTTTTISNPSRRVRRRTSCAAPDDVNEDKSSAKSRGKKSVGEFSGNGSNIAG